MLGFQADKRRPVGDNGQLRPMLNSHASASGGSHPDAPPNKCRVGRVFEAHHHKDGEQFGGPRRLGPPYEKSSVAMITSRRCTKVLLAGLLSCLAFAPMGDAGRLRADPTTPCGPVLLPPHRPEPPLADWSAVPSPLAQGVPYPQDPPTPVVAIRVRVPASVAAGQDLDYRICVENRSSAAAHHVLVHNPLPANARFVRASREPSATDPELVWRLGTLEAGAKQEIVLTLAPTGTGDVNNCARVQFEHGQCVRTKVTKPALKIHKTGPTQAHLYDALTYKLTLTNTGTAELTNVLLTDVIPKGLEHESGKSRLSWIVGSLAPGESQSVDYQVMAKAVGRLCNKAIATADGGLRQEIETCVTVGEAKLDVKMTGPKRRYLNLPAKYEISLTNPGTATLSQVMITNPLPAGTTFISATEDGQLADNEVRWSLGTLAPGARRSVAVVLQAQTEGRICNKATVSADRGLTKQAEACTDFIGVPALSLEVVDSNDPIEVGTATAYKVTVRNQGTTPATHVRIVATVPNQLEVTRAAGSANFRKEGQKITYEPITLEPAGEARYRIEVKAVRAGDVRFKVELTADQLTAGPVQQEESTAIYAALPPSR